jgi:hypothetical protein
VIHFKFNIIVVLKALFGEPRYPFAKWFGHENISERNSKTTIKGPMMFIQRTVQ